MGFTLAKIFGADVAVKDVIGGVGKGIGSIADRLGFTKKMSDVEKIDKQIELIKATADSDKNDMEDLKSAREMAIAQMQTQPASWLVRNMNGALRPSAGWLALICITNKTWGKVLEQMLDGFLWNPIEFSATEQLCLTGILGFFFGFRQRAKEKGVHLNQ